MKAKHVRSWSIVIGLVLLLAGTTVALTIIGPDAIVERIGVKNTYVTVLLLAAIGGLSTLTSTSLFAAIGTFSAGGAHPLLLGLFAGTGIFISDTVFFHVAQYGKSSLPEKWEKHTAHLTRWLNRQSKYLVMLFIFIWIGFSPLPNDILMIALAAAGYRYWTVAPLLLAGGVSIATITAYAARAGESLF